MHNSGKGSWCGLTPYRGDVSCSTGVSGGLRMVQYTFVPACILKTSLGVQVEKYGGRIAYDPDSAGSPRAAPATPSTATAGAPGPAAGTSNGAPAGNASADAESPGLGEAEPAPARAGGSDAAAAPATPEQAPGRSQSPGPNQAPSPNQAPGRGAGQQHVVAFEQRDQVDPAGALRVGDPVEFLLMPGGPGRRPHATQVGFSRVIAQAKVFCGVCALALQECLLSLPYCFGRSCQVATIYCCDSHSIG